MKPTISPMDSPHSVIKEAYRLLQEKKESILIIVKDWKEGSTIFKSITTRLNHEVKTHESIPSQLRIILGDSSLKILTELQIHKMSSDYSNVFYNPILDQDTVNTIEFKARMG
jgi:hypothetical protein